MSNMVQVCHVLFKILALGLYSRACTLMSSLLEEMICQDWLSHNNLIRISILSLGIQIFLLVCNVLLFFLLSVADWHY